MADKWKKDSWIYKATLPKTEEPPKTYEEFLKFNSWDYWPRNVNFIIDNTWESNLKKIKEENTFMPIYSYLSNNVPLTFEAGRVMESRLKKCTMCLEEHASKLFEWNVMATKESKPYFSYSHEKIEKYKAFLQKYGKEKKIMLSDEMKAEKNIQGYNFPGFKTDAVTPLPRHIDAKRVYLFVLKNRVIEEKLRKIWRYHFLSEASIELLHDCFWWWFLYKFKPDRKNEDYLFDRISENYAVLFLSIPIRQKDTFLQVYPDYLAQAICAVFYEAFPESAALFNDEFKKDLGNTIHLWMTGLKPAKGFWTHWNLKDLLTTTIHGINKVPEKTLMEKIIKSQERLLTTMEFNIKQILQNPRGYKRIEVKEVQTSRPTIKSHYRSFGPEFHRILFNFGGQSPLILYYLKKHEPAGNFGTAKQNKFKLTEISKVPTAPAPTYRDTIKEAKRQFAKNRKDFRIEKQTITEQIKVLKKRQERIDKELTRLQEKATRKPFEAKAEAENFLYELHVEEEQERKLIISPSSSSESSLSIPENYDYQEEKTRRGKMTLYSFIVS